jgi:hypothetical protein
MLSNLNDNITLPFRAMWCWVVTTVTDINDFGNLQFICHFMSTASFAPHASPRGDQCYFPLPRQKPWSSCGPVGSLGWSPGSRPAAVWPWAGIATTLSLASYEWVLA